MKIKTFTTDAQHNAYTYRHIKKAQARNAAITNIILFIIPFAVILALLLYKY